MEYKGNVLYTNLKEVKFDFPIKQVANYKGIYIVLISPLDDLEYPLNVFGVNNEGDIMWKIKSFNGEQIIFHSIEVDNSKNKLYLKDSNHFKYIVDCETGDIISGKLRPLEDDNSVEKNNNIGKANQGFQLNLGNLKSFTDKKLLIGVLFVVGVIFIIISSKNLKIKSLEKQIAKQNTLIETLQETLILQEETVTGYEQQITELERLLASGTMMTTNDYEEQEYIETVEAPSVDNDLDNGVSTVIDFIDSFVNNVSTGTPVTIEEVNNSTSKVTEGFYVESIIDGERIMVSNGGEQNFVVRLISVSGCSADTLSQIIPKGTQIYLETDSKQYNDEGEMLAYVWVTAPNPDNLKAMVNYAVLKSGLGSFVNQSPNIKYNRFFF